MTLDFSCTTIEPSSSFTEPPIAIYTQIVLMTFVLGILSFLSLPDLKHIDLGILAFT